MGDTESPVVKVGRALGNSVKCPDNVSDDNGIKVSGQLDVRSPFTSKQPIRIVPRHTNGMTWKHGNGNPPRISARDLGRGEERGEG